MENASRKIQNAIKKLHIVETKPFYTVSMEWFAARREFQSIKAIKRNVYQLIDVLPIDRPKLSIDRYDYHSIDIDYLLIDRNYLLIDRNYQLIDTDYQSIDREPALQRAKVLKRARIGLFYSE